MSSCAAGATRESDSVRICEAEDGSRPTNTEHRFWDRRSCRPGSGGDGARPSSRSVVGSGRGGRCCATIGLERLAAADAHGAGRGHCAHRCADGIDGIGGDILPHRRRHHEGRARGRIVERVDGLNHRGDDILDDPACGHGLTHHHGRHLIRGRGFVDDPDGVDDLDGVGHLDLGVVVHPQRHHGGAHRHDAGRVDQHTARV